MMQLINIVRATYESMTHPLDLAVPRDEITYMVLARAIAATFGTATILVAYAIAARIGGRLAGLLSAFFLAFAVLHLQRFAFRHHRHGHDILLRPCGVVERPSRRARRYDIADWRWGVGGSRSGVQVHRRDRLGRGGCWILVAPTGKEATRLGKKHPTLILGDVVG